MGGATVKLPKLNRVAQHNISEITQVAATITCHLSDRLIALTR